MMARKSRQLWKSGAGMGRCILAWMVVLLFCSPAMPGLAQDDGTAAENKDGNLGALAPKNVYRIDSALMALENRPITVQQGPLQPQLLRQVEPVPAFPRLNPTGTIACPVYYPDKKSPAPLPLSAMASGRLLEKAEAGSDRIMGRFRPAGHPAHGIDADDNLPSSTPGSAAELADRLKQALAFGGVAGRPDPEALHAALRRMQQFKRTYKDCQTDLMDPGMPGKNSLSGLKPGQRLLAGARFDAGWGAPRNVEIHPNLLYRFHAGLTAGVSLMIGFPVASASRQNLRLGSGILLQQVVWKGFFLSGEMLVGWPGRSDQSQGSEEGSRIGFRAGLGRELSHNDRMRSQLLLSYDFSKREFAESPLRIGMGFGFPLRRP